jgi:hypothetical protein
MKRTSTHVALGHNRTFRKDKATARDVYFEDEPRRRSAAKLLSKLKARQTAVNIAN